MLDILFENEKDMYFGYLQIDPKKFTIRRIQYALILAVMLLFGYIFLEQVLMLVALPIAAYVGWKLPYIELKRSKSYQDILISYAFPRFLTYFICLIETKGNVYQTLKATVPYLQSTIQVQVESLIKAMEDNPENSRDAFVKFAEYIGTGEANMIMNTIYEFTMTGISKEDLKELESMISSIESNKNRELIDYKVNESTRYAVIPIIASVVFIFGFVVIIFMKSFSQINL